MNIVSFPDKREATVDFPTPRPPTIDVIVSCVSNSGMVCIELSCALACSSKTPDNFFKLIVDICN